MGRKRKLTDEEVLSYVDYTPMEFSQYNYMWDKIEDTNICPICGKHIKITLFHHMILERDDKNHMDFLKKQIEHANMLFYDTTMRMHPSIEEIEYRGIYIGLETFNLVWNENALYEEREKITKNVPKNKNAIAKEPLLNMYCPICNVRRRTMKDHFKYYKDEEHENFLKNQKEYAKLLFWNLDINNQFDLQSIGMYLSFPHIGEIWKQTYTAEQIEEHRLLMTYPKH